LKPVDLQGFAEGPMSRICIVATGEWRPKRPVIFLFVAIFAILIILLIGAIIYPELASILKLERHPDSFYENRIRETPSMLLFAAGVAMVVAIISRLLK
jgi:MFS family permease